MSLASISIRNPVFAWMLMAGFIIFGVVSFLRLPVGQYPDVDFPTISINCTLSGAPPEQMEADVIDPLEDTVMAVEGVNDVESSCSMGTAHITINFDISRNVDLAFQDVQARVSEAAKLLPPNMDPVQITKTNPEDQPIMWIAVSGTRSQQDISQYAKNVLRDRFLTVEGTGDINMGGYLARNMRIWIRNDKLQELGLTVTDVLNAIQREHVQSDSGRIEGALRESNVNFHGEAMNTQQMGGILVADHAGAPVYLRDVALVEDGFEDRRRISRSNGLPAQGLGVIKQHGSNTVAVADAARKRVAELQKTLPKGMRMDIRVDQSKYIKDSIGEIEVTLVLAVLLTSIVCWLFLGSLSATLNVLLAIPVSVCGTFMVMYFMGFSLNTFTLLALSLAVGIVVDDAVMVLENIYRHAEMGKNPVRAARDGTEQITTPALAATLAIIAIFLPVGFMTGIIGKFFFQFGVVLAVAVGLSLLDALTLSPALCSQFLKVGKRSNIIERTSAWVFARLEKFYRWMLGGILNFRFGRIPAGSLLVLAVATAGFIVSLSLVSHIPKEMVPAQDQGFYMMRVTTPVGSSIDYTESVMQQIEKILGSHKELQANLVIAGTGDVNSGIAFVTMKPQNERTVTQGESLASVRRETAHKFPGTSVIMVDFSQSGFAAAHHGGGLISFSIRGPDWDTLGKLSDKFMQQMTDTKVLTDINSDYRKGMREVEVTPNRTKALAHGVAMDAIANTIGALIGGEKVGQFTGDGHRYDIRVRLLKDERTRPEDIDQLYVRSTTGVLIPLSDVVDVKVVPSLQTINHMNRERAVTIDANPAPGHSQGEAQDEVSQLAKTLPEGYHITFSGNSQAFVETFQSLIFAVVMGLVCAYMVLASQFNSFLHPFTIFLALPFSVSGALIAIFLCHLTLNLYSMIGIILLMGIVKKNSILLVDYTNQMREAGHDTVNSLIRACPIRLRPILMTTVATIAAAVPGAMSLGPGGELRVPMSVAIIGGLVVSTLLTLVVVPSFYDVVDEVRTKLFGPAKNRVDIDAESSANFGGGWDDPQMGGAAIKKHAAGGAATPAPSPGTD
ncbi:MAG: efflux RND transporter permease subunit [Planctomycetota bacterium]